MSMVPSSRIKPSGSLKFQVSVFIAILLIVCVMAVSWLSISKMEKAINQKVKEGEMVASLIIREEIQHFLDSKGEIVKNLSLAQEFQSQDKKQILKLLLSAQNQSEFQNIYFVTGSGEITIAPVKQLPKDFDPRQRVWYQEAVKKGTMVCTDPYIDQATGKPCMTVALAVKDSEGRFVGVLGADIKLETISSLAVKYKFGEEGYFYVCDKQGKVIGHPDAKAINGDIMNRAYVKAALAGKSGFDTYADNGVKKLVYYSEIPKTGWGLFVQQPEQEAYAELYRARNMIIIITLLILASALVISLYFTGKMVNVIKMVGEGARAIAQGNLTYSLTIARKDELGILSDSINEMTNHLKTIIGGVKDSTNRVTGACNSMAVSMEQIHEASDKNASDISNVAATTEQITASAENINEMVGSVSLSAQHGQEEIGEVIGAMEGIKSSTNEISRAISEVENQSKKIQHITTIITQIAEQTNLLALNAAIEAARAGEHGKGFTVVADEVRKLAEQTSAATREIHGVIENVYASVRDSVDKMLTGNEMVEMGSQRVQEAGEVFKTITINIEELVEKMAQITRATITMSASIQNVAAASQEQAAIIEEENKMVEDLRQSAIVLDNMVQKFVV
ncbi:methyl-accepting chemotaxis sensory transducer [Desulforamulus reducens MI-1]|uniref:Methyl-accepting chemotaxis sensory transducer n=1 Tax=Desulforamulus reducens (strain ATCC BAA-1160 / DSM 100696 / MI-1) TaxID=349161 RepID=A4J3R2_DESRM|nr:methyl-accepting chemotaxis protein [Desulforamulus reducens]ABO49715.1 methyl-accepting chemotaxis sensory transducer [Desulforamulus reducens MI-1]